jgi:hypothetical protein
MLPGRILILLSTPDGTEVTLEERYANDQWLLGFCKDKLLEPGWAGELDSVELEHIKSHLKQSPSLRRRWGFRPSAKRLSESRIRAVVMYGVSRKQKQVLAAPAREQTPSPP